MHSITEGFLKKEKKNQAKRDRFYHKKERKKERNMKNITKFFFNHLKRLSDKNEGVVRVKGCFVGSKKARSNSIRVDTFTFGQIPFGSPSSPPKL